MASGVTSDALEVAATLDLLETPVVSGTLTPELSGMLALVASVRLSETVKVAWLPGPVEEPP